MKILKFLRKKIRKVESKIIIIIRIEKLTLIINKNCSQNPLTASPTALLFFKIGLKTQEVFQTSKNQRKLERKCEFTLKKEQSEHPL